MIIANKKEQGIKDNFIVVDIETTGISPEMNTITEIGAIKVINNEVVGTYSQLINPEAVITAKITEITGLTNEILKDEPILDDIYSEFLEFAEELPLVGHNIIFDFSFLKYQGNCRGYEFERSGIDTLFLASNFVPELRSKSLTSLIAHYGINREIAHRAYHDALATYELYLIFKEQYMNEFNKEYFLPKALFWKPKKSSPITPKQKSFLTSLIRKHNMFNNIQVDQLTKSEASRYIDQILSKTSSY